MSKRLQDRVCIITGSSSGLGRAIALGYAREGAAVVCADLRPTPRGEDGADETHAVIEKSGGRAIFVTTDVSRSEDFENLVKAAVGTFGRIDVYVLLCHEKNQKKRAHVANC